MDSFSELQAVQNSYMTIQGCPTCELYSGYVASADLLRML